jgi:D-alanine-D-alanine ligase-like ATP-grasp enzyme
MHPIGATPDFKIRSHANGWIFARNNTVIPDICYEYAIQAAQGLGIHHGAIDVIWDKKRERAMVLEVNTAPGLMGTSLTKYVDFFVEEIKNG